MQKTTITVHEITEKKVEYVHDIDLVSADIDGLAYNAETAKIELRQNYEYKQFILKRGKRDAFGRLCAENSPAALGDCVELIAYPIDLDNLIQTEHRKQRQDNWDAILKLTAKCDKLAWERAALRLRFERIGKFERANVWRRVWAAIKGTIDV